MTVAMFSRRPVLRPVVRPVLSPEHHVTAAEAAALRIGGELTHVRRSLADLLVGQAGTFGTTCRVVRINADHFRIDLEPTPMEIDPAVREVLARIEASEDGGA